MASLRAQRPSRRRASLLPALLAGTLALLSCSKGGALVLVDPAWALLSPGAGQDLAKGAQKTGYRVSSPPALAEPYPEKAFEALAAAPGIKTLILSPLLALECPGISAARPELSLIAPGTALPPWSADLPDAPDGQAASVEPRRSWSDPRPALTALGRAAARLEKPGSGVAALLLLPGPDGDAEEAAFRQGFGPDREILVRRAPAEGPGAESSIREILESKPSFIYVSLASRSIDALTALPPSGPPAASRNAAELKSAAPGLAWTIEDDWIALCASALRGRESAPARLIELP